MDASRVLDLLVLECDHVKLQREGLAIGKAAALSAAIGGWFSAGKQDRKQLGIELLEIDRREDLLAGLGHIAEKYRAVKAVLVIAHSNENCMVVAGDHVLPWRVVGRYLAPLRPTHIGLVACEAGARSAASELAADIPTIKEIIASPASATKALVLYVVGLLASRLHRRRIEPGSRFLAQVALAVVGKNVVFHWDRGELRETSFDEVVASSFLEAGAKLLVRALRERTPGA